MSPNQREDRRAVNRDDFPMCVTKELSSTMRKFLMLAVVTGALTILGSGSTAQAQWGVSLYGGNGGYSHGFGGGYNSGYGRGYGNSYGNGYGYGQNAGYGNHHNHYGNSGYGNGHHSHHSGGSGWNGSGQNYGRGYGNAYGNSCGNGYGSGYRTYNSPRW